jgi:GTPase SAR1 family protein
MRGFDALVVVGSSGSGKTTLVNGIRSSKFEESVVIPRRYITRPARQGDDHTENLHVDHGTFANLVHAGRINPAWARELDRGRIEQYGFEALGDGEGRLPIYSANNAFLRDRNPSVEGVLVRGFVVVVTASQLTRDSRLAERSPDLSSEERSVRLGDGGEGLPLSELPHAVIDTSMRPPEEGQARFQELIGKVLLAQ